MNKNIKISEATRADEPELLTFFKHYNVDEITRGRVECYLSHNRTIVAKDGNKVVGVVQWYVKEDPKAGVVEFEEFYVLEDYRGQGIGTEIFRTAIESAKNYFNKIGIKLRKIYFFVSESNTNARKLYEKLGFANVTCVGNLFGDEEPELFYCLNVK